MPMTDPMYVLPAAVEAAQRTASEIVAEAIRAAETAGYERGRREAREAASQAPLNKLRALLTRATEVLGEAEESTSGIDGSQESLAAMHRLSGVLSEIRALLGIKDADEESEDADEGGEEPDLRVGSAFLVGGPTEEG